VIASPQGFGARHSLPLAGAELCPAYHWEDGIGAARPARGIWIGLEHVESPMM